MSRRETFGLYTAVEGKLAAGDSRAAYVEGPIADGTRIAPIGSFWFYDDARRFACARHEETTRLVEMNRERDRR